MDEDRGTTSEQAATKGLRVNELLQAVYIQLKVRNPGNTFDFAGDPNTLEADYFKVPIFTIIADDSDHHRQRRGLFVYKEAHVAKIGETIWAFAYSFKGGSYPGRRYAGDIAALSFTVDSTLEKPAKIDRFFKSKTWIKDEQEESLRWGAKLGLDHNGDYFRFSVIRGMSDGDLNIPEQSLYHKKQDLEAFLRQEKDKHIAVPPQIDANHITADLRPVVSQVTRYDKEFVNSLADAIQQSFYPVEKKE